LQILLEGVSLAVMENKPDDIAEFFALYFQDLVIFRKGHPDLDITDTVLNFEFAREHINTLFAGEPKRKDKCTDTEEDQLLREPGIQWSSKVTQRPSTASSTAESKSPPGSARPSFPERPELLYVPTEATQLAAPALGTADPFSPVRDVVTSVQTLYEDSQTSESEFTPVEDAAEDVSAVPAAGASVGAVRSQPAGQSPSSPAGDLGPSDSQAGVSTDDVNRASSVTLWEEPSPPSPPPSPAPRDPSQAVPSCSDAEVASAPEAVALWWDGEPIMGAEVP
ncbi:CABYR protein, partial [Rhinoptilus africanus]|nr:CABYR protein [Rhinoptilus africanus]